MPLKQPTNHVMDREQKKKALHKQLHKQNANMNVQ